MSRRVEISKVWVYKISVDFYRRLFCSTDCTICNKLSNKLEP
jgi:hypothetical protein